MFNNKFFFILLILAIALILYYSFGDTETFELKTKKSFEKYKTELIEMEGSPLLNKNPNKFVFFEPNKELIFEAAFIADSQNKTFEMLMTDSTNQGANLAGKAKFQKNGKTFEVLVFEEETSYLLPFNDFTNTKTTYGGGRYLNIPKSDLLGDAITLDFNLARNFYCAYNEKYICPIPPKENRIALEINAGEKKYLE